jgi:ABC-type phosphate transport system substrate-binding protein
VTRTRRVGVVGLLLAALAGITLTTVPMAADAQSPAPGSQPERAKTRDDSWTATKTITRQFVQPDGTTYSFPSHKVTVTAEHTKNLRGRQRILIKWKGAQPSGGRASNPYGENGLNQEYPVVVLQCRGVDDPSLPKKQQLSPANCWTASVAQRSQITRSEGEAAWTHDLFAAPEDKARISGLDPFPSAEECPTADIDPYFTRLTPFVTAKGETFPACDADHMPPEAAVGAAFPPAEVAAFTDLDGTGSVQFEVRSDVENESLGCSDKVDCSIVVIPIAGISCDQPSSPVTLADQACRKGGRFPAGSSNFANEGADQAVSPALWWSASNWKNRFSIPVTFGLPPDACDVLDPRAPTGFYGSELLAQAALQWAPAYCLNKQRFKFQLNQMSDEAGWNNMEAGIGVAAEVSSEHDLRGSDPVGYAPTAVTGFAIGYQIDKPDNAGEVTDLKLNARLLAKLLTQSYLGSDLGRGHPGIGNNPLAIMNDPEFIKLNPGLSQITQEVGATVLSLSNSSDVIEQLTDYIAHDADAMAFIHGKKDPWGMVVNPKYKNLAMPRADIPLLDSYIPETQSDCRQKNPAVYFNQLAAPVTTMRKIAEALLDAWPNVQTRCDFDTSTGAYKLGRVDRQSFGSRFMLGIVSLGDADRYGLRAAALETKPGTYVAPSDKSLAAAVALTKQKKAHQPFVLDQGDARKSGHAYPGTMIVYTAARLHNLAKDDAAKVAQFIRISTTEGQQPGSGNGELPDGFLPIQKTGVTEKLFDAAQDTARAVEAQRSATSEPTEEPSGDGGDGPGGLVTPPGLPGDGEPSTDVSPSTTPSVPPTAVEMPATAPVGSDLAGGLLPLLILLGAIGCLAATAVRVAAPVMRRRR